MKYWKDGIIGAGKNNTITLKRIQPKYEKLMNQFLTEDLRAIAAGKGVSWPTLGAAGALAVVYVFLAGLFFARVHRYAVRTGLIARYSAESVT